jgi:hypothetical protein
LSRSGFTDDGDDELEMGRWRGILASATRGKRGQVFFRALVAALDAMPEKRLIANELERDGEVCALGALGRARGVDMSRLRPEDDECGDEIEWDYGALGDAFAVAPSLTREVMFMNDELDNRTPEARWEKVRRWAAYQIIPTEAELETSTDREKGGRDGEAEDEHR